jgi:hypothetical protein
VRQRLDEVELRLADKGDGALGDGLVIHGVLHVVAFRGARAINRYFKVDHHGLPDVPLPVEEPDRGLDGKTAQKNRIG